MNKSSLFDVMSFYLCGKAVNYRLELYKRCIQFFITAFADWCFLQMFHIFELVARSIHAMARYVEYIPVEAIRHTKDIIATEPYSKGAFNEFLRFVLIPMNFPSSKKKLYV